MTIKNMAPLRRPESATAGFIGWSGFAGLLLSSIVLIIYQPFDNVVYSVLAVMSSVALGIYIPDIFVNKIYKKNLVHKKSINTSRILTKIVGLYITMIIIAAIYWLLPEYHGSFYNYYWEMLSMVVPIWVLSAPFYIWWVDCRMANPQDSLWQFGRLFMFKADCVNHKDVFQYILSWIVKAFFLPLMFVYACMDMHEIMSFDLNNNIYNFKSFYDYSYTVLYYIDVSLISITYLISLRVTDTHIRTTEKTMLGWVVALICYQPFWSIFETQFLNYDRGPQWGDHLINMPILYTFWGILILLCVMVYVWATISFGGRFSNLTNRGIITNGPYKYTKHPAYISKNISWWLISMPFMPYLSIQATIQNCILLLMLNGIYYLRAKTEERHLLSDPTYQEYVEWMDNNGKLKWMNNLPVIGALSRWRMM